MASIDTRRETNKVSTYDVFVDKKWLFVAIGFWQSKSAIYTIYTGGLLLLNIYMASMALYAAYLVAPRMSLIIDALHGMIAVLFAGWLLSSRIITDRTITRMRRMIEEGIYYYEGEELDKEEIEMREGIAVEIKKKAHTIHIMYIIGYTTNMVFFPISQVMLVSEDTPGVLNPYLPGVFYSPFETRNVVGYIAAYLLDMFFWAFVYMTAVSVNGVYTSFTTHLKMHMKILNRSLMKIEKRAHSMYNKTYTGTGQFSGDRLFDNKEFNNCMYACLRANILHHQALLRFKQESQMFIGSVLLDVFTLASINYACTMYGISQSPPINILLSYIMTNMAEQTYTVFICFFGEEVMTESKVLYETLYAISWYDYDERFKKALEIMICCTRKPIEIKAMLVGTTSSLETYGHILTLMYKLMNVARQADVLS